ncbi:MULTISPECIES: hypothetical protein [Paenibacillus]|nr:hypothetical protein [Paenibacillus odorifer]
MFETMATQTCHVWADRMLHISTGGPSQRAAKDESVTFQAEQGKCYSLL